jgi:hypothetical protein
MTNPITTRRLWMTLGLILGAGFLCGFQFERKAEKDLVEPGVKEVMDHLEKWWKDLGSKPSEAPKPKAEAEPRPRATLETANKPIEIKPEDPEEKDLDKKIEDRIKDCAIQQFFKQPVKNSAKAGLLAAIAEYRAGGGEAQVLQAANEAFEKKFKEDVAGLLNPMKDLGAIVECVLTKAVDAPVRQAFAKCIATKAFQGQASALDCFKRALLAM